MKKISILNLLILFTVSIFAQENKFEEISLVPHTSPKDQARAGTCWSFSTVSFMEAEVLRITEKEFDLSETFAVYYAYLNKADIYVKFHGNHTFGQGGQAHDVIDVVTEYGMVTEEAYPYANKDHTQLEKDLKNYLDSILKLDTLPRQWVVDYKSILDKSLGVPPSTFEYEGKEYTPKDFTKDILKFDADNYIELTSYNHHDFYTQFVLEVPDNWSLDMYYNVPIEILISTMINAVKNSYTIVWDGDVSEEGFSKDGTAKMISKKGGKYMTMSAQPHRQMLFDRHFSTDDHLMHIVGLFQENVKKLYFKVKNSWAEYPPYDGYHYMSEDYMKYKTVAILIHKDALSNETKTKLNIK